MSRFWICTALGVGVTGVLTFIAIIIIASGSWTVACAFVWQACLVVYAIPCANIGTPEERFCEGTPLHLFAFLFGLGLGVPLYGLLAYAIIRIVGGRWGRLS